MRSHWLAGFLNDLLTVLLSACEYVCLPVCISNLLSFWLAGWPTKGEKHSCMDKHSGTEWMTNKSSHNYIKYWLIANDICKKRWEWREGQPSYVTVWVAALVSYGDTTTYLRSVKISKCSQFPWWQYKYGYPNLTFRSSNTTSSMRLLVNKPSPGHFLLWGSFAQSIITLIE